MRRGWFGGRDRRSVAEATVELALVAASAEGVLTARWGPLARLLTEDDELGALEWDWITQRAEAIASEAPLFTEARARIVAALSGSEQAPRALALARRLAGPGEALDAETLLGDVAERLGLPPPPAGPPLPDLVRARFDDPERTEQLRFHEALRRAEPEERRLLLDKLQLARRCLAHLGPAVRVRELGHERPRGHALLRFDAVFERTGEVFWGRLLGRGEALHPVERRQLPELVGELALGERLLVAHLGPLAPPDRARLDALPLDAVQRIEAP